MSINPRMPSTVHQEILEDSFHSGESPYYAMYKAGRYGVPLYKVIDYTNRQGIPLRTKDLDNYDNGYYEYQMNALCAKPIKPKRSVSPTKTGVPFDEAKLSDFEKLPVGWKGTAKRFFPCSMDNKPMMRWGWTREFTPALYTYVDAKVLSPCGYVGQNMLYQPFVVFDIDGRGHGEDDKLVIEFGNIFRNQTLTMEDPAKPGSFHLYFRTDRLIPVRHFSWAKLDLMGNAVNAAVYLKTKKSNGKDMMLLDDNVWKKLMDYQRYRKELL